MPKGLTTLTVALSLFAMLGTTAPAHAGLDFRPRVTVRPIKRLRNVTAAIRTLSDKHASKIAVASFGVAPVAGVVALVAQGTPVKVAAGSVMVMSLLNGAVHVGKVMTSAFRF
jgi:hypothetical protein